MLLVLIGVQSNKPERLAFKFVEGFKFVGANADVQL